MKWSEVDKIYINSLGISNDELDRQYKLLISGGEYPEIVEPATLKKGIVELSENEKTALKIRFEKQHENYDCGRFIPASGAATRMFSSLVQFIQTGELNNDAKLFSENISVFAFHELIKIETDDISLKIIIERILFENGLNYLNLPKGLIPFHRSEEMIFTAAQSQLAESGKYALDKKGITQTHFTINENYSDKFKEHVESFALELEKQTGIKHQLDFSYQSKSTDTISIDENQDVVRDEEGNICFRPGGHGSLLKNLNELDHDLIFIRNIDNVVSPASNQEYVNIHKILGGYLIHLLERLYQIQSKVESLLPLSEEEIQFLKATFHYWDEDLKEFVFRPVRVCGMVKNQGEPGGGPFWISDNKGKSSLQIIESAQVNNNDENQKGLFNQSTHFNPVDIVCSIKNYKGEKYDLNAFRNENLSFVSTKKHNGDEIRILEHPGLWNGSMHNWLTVFIEIPETVFNPVKTVNDLLRPAHRR